MSNHRLHCRKHIKHNVSLRSLQEFPRHAGKKRRSPFAFILQLIVCGRLHRAFHVWRKAAVVTVVPTNFLTDDDHFHSIINAKSPIVAA